MRFRRNSLFIHYILFFVLVLIVIAGMYVYVAHEVKELVYRQIGNDLADTAGVLMTHLPSPSRNPRRIDPYCKAYTGASDIRVTVIQASGEVLGDSDYPITMMNNHGDRPEVIGALRNQETFTTRYSVTLGKHLAYLAIPVVEYGGIEAVFRISRPVDEITSFIQALNIRIFSFLILISIVALFYGYFLSGKVQSIFSALTDSFEKIDAGEYDIALDLAFPSEARLVSEKMNTMARNLENSMNEISARNRQLEAILTNMVEPVVLLDRDLRIVHLNRAATRMMELERDALIGKSVLESFRNSALYEFALAVQQAEEALETSITLAKEQQLVYLQVHGTLVKSPVAAKSISYIPDTPYQKDSVLLVFNNITRIKNLEQIRQDFVANVSHELKTPITSITGFVETLTHGAIDDRDEALHFLKIIDKQSRRLNSIIDDLLSLSKLENLEHRDLEFEDCIISSVVSAAVQLCMDKAQKKSIEIIQRCDSGMKAEVIPLLIEQALVNIVDNAVKYSDPESRIIISGTESENYIHLSIEDYGRGIPEKDLPRIFERFYRVDKARSREMGGTGLGLSITKHIIRVNNGTIRVTSEPGVGTTFYINLPKQQQS